jgi:hypothetical protein
MSSLALVTMIVICSVVWGGSLLLVVTALRSEARRRQGG